MIHINEPGTRDAQGRPHVELILICSLNRCPVIPATLRPRNFTKGWARPAYKLVSMASMLMKKYPFMSISPTAERSAGIAHATPARPTRRSG
jgi:hypothetical protein